jgi:hypothetical protein
MAAPPSAPLCPCRAQKVRPSQITTFPSLARLIAVPFSRLATTATALRPLLNPAYGKSVSVTLLSLLPIPIHPPLLLSQKREHTWSLLGWVRLGPHTDTSSYRLDSLFPISHPPLRPPYLTTYLTKFDLPDPCDLLFTRLTCDSEHSSRPCRPQIITICFGTVTR